MAGESQQAMTCGRLKELLRAGAAGEELEHVAQAITGHIERCPTCSTAETALSTMLARYRQAEQPPLPHDLERRLLDLLCRSPEA
ncbi:MAG: hypothetical protein KatS3mg057_0080 [Herpetosiphonaceae bacterium]|nr:MAG: hypothetical protein KatS3mg057_0080 [Herpetosiphonaceae bacterium]